MEFEKYKLILEFEEANRLLSVQEKAELTSYSIGHLAQGLRMLVRKEWESRELYNVIVADQLLVRDKFGFGFRPVYHTLSGQKHRFTKAEIEAYEPKLMQFAKKVEYERKIYERI